MVQREKPKAPANSFQVRDDIDETLEQWVASIPNLDTSSLDIILRISRLGLLFNRSLERFLRPYHINIGEMDVLFALLKAGPPYEQRPSDISKGCKVTTGATTGRVSRLMAIGLVERSASPRDRRELRVRLTQSGKSIAEKLRCEASHTTSVRDALSALSVEDRAEFIRLLRAFTYVFEHPQAP